ncbi:M20 metallopeptidase family protein [Glaciibacter sp. 2TAF33]|uniref:M20 metallopeptidase family protein n=1 Tax=Glaciibacter sp. 2TAF33 TaxID=3233015 RepID=UPI003F8F7177
MTLSTLNVTADAALTDELIAFRREMHADPETGLQLPRTQARVLEALKDLDLESVLGAATTSVVAILRGGGVPSDVVGADRPTVLLRGDMDALPITEKSGVSFASTNGAMHACGHDLHTAGLIGAAKLLHAVRDRLPGDVVFMFQPGEEIFAGAQAMLDEGLLQLSGSRPLAAYGVHMASDAPAGLFTTRPGSYMAAFGQLDVTVKGRGGHGSRPFQALDPIQVAAEMVGALQTYITRRFNVFDPVILTVGEFHGGSAANIIPDEATFKAGIRCFSPEVEVRLGAELANLIESIARAHQLTADAVFELKLPVTANTASEAEFWAATAADLFGADRFETLQFPKAGSEDFSKILLEVPGSFGHIGAGSPDVDPSEWAPLHSPRAQFDDRVLGDQASFLATLAVRRLAAATAA